MLGAQLLKVVLLIFESAMLVGGRGPAPGGELPGRTLENLHSHDLNVAQATGV